MQVVFHMEIHKDFAAEALMKFPKYEEMANQKDYVKTVIENLCENIEAELNTISDRGLNSSNMESAYKLLDMYKNCKKIEYMKQELAKEEYAKIELVTIVYGDDLTDKSYQEMQGLIDTYPELKGVISPTTVGIAAAATCIQDNDLTGVIKLTGLGLPSEMAEYITAGVCEGMYLWNPIDLGYCAAYASVGMVKGEIAGTIGETFEAGRLGTIEIYDDGAGNPFTIVGDPYNFTAENIEDWKNVY